MIQIKKYAAIDIGSNAMRLLITNIIEQKGKEVQFNKSALIRVPLRLGQDAFTVGEISEENIDKPHHRSCNVSGAFESDL